MTNISLKSIKYESIKAIINSISETDRISRAEISEKTDLSLVTVGKIADALLERNVVTQIKEIRSQAGRRAGLLSVNPERFALILDFTRYQFRCAILNLRLDTLDKFTF
ncbi:MAG: winged helix-turn-helix transcriptional regulator, partial [Clostridiales bacterium]|nr:winged helix-turn-helix transcriptional regulator [Clostridiales bacterium]